MAEATINAGPYGVGHTKRVIAEALSQKAASASWWERLQRAPKSAWGFIQSLAQHDLVSRALEFCKGRIDWLRGFVNDIGLGRVVAYVLTTRDGRTGFRKGLGIGFRILALPFRLVGKPVSWVLRHTGRPGAWVRSTAIIWFCWTRDKAVGVYDQAEAWMDAHHDSMWMNWARGWLRWTIVSRLVDRLAARWMPRWLTFIIKLIASDIIKTAAETVADGLMKVGDILDEDEAEAADTVTLPVGLVSGVRKFRNTATGQVHRFDVLEGSDGMWLRPRGSSKPFVKASVPDGYEVLTLEEVASEFTGGGEVPQPGNRAEKREASREAKRPVPTPPLTPPPAAPTAGE